MLDRWTIERFAPSGSARPFVVAYSGGGDSTALLALLAQHTDRRLIHAVIVDHALREGSDHDARIAAGLAGRLEVAHVVARLDWPPGAKRSQASARQARYGALCRHARAIGARDIVLGHTSDDQAETVFMRAAAGSSWRGLAGMAALAPAPLWPDGRGLLVARPLLQVPRAALRAYLTERGLDWIEDPANANVAYERVRVRARLADLEAAGLQPMRFAGIAAQLRPRVDALEDNARALIAAAARFGDDVIVLDRARWTGDGQSRRRALSALIAAAAGAPREPMPAPLERLDAQMREEGFTGAALGGATLTPKAGAIRVARDLGALMGRADGKAAAPALALDADRDTVWDGRLLLRARAPGWSLQLHQGAPVLVNGTTRRALDQAPQSDIAVRWLLEERVHHLLSRID